MKKVLSLVLALAMVLGSFSFVSAADFADVTDATLAKAVDRLALLDVLTGYPDGSFKPEQTITRAEFAAVAVRAKGLEDAANAAKGLATGFNDVAAGNWAAGYVGTAGKLGIVNGVGNGLFAPNAPVKYEEAITMMVRALGYEAAAQAKGGYPYGYLIVANEIGLLDDVKGTQGTPASRGIVAQIADNALEIPKMIQVGFGSDAKWVISGSQEHGDEAVAQLLLHDLGVDEIKGRVVNNFRTKGTVKSDEVEIANIVEGKTIKYEVTEDVDVDAILFAGVTAWAKDDVIFSASVGYNFRYNNTKYVFDAEQILHDSIENPATASKTTDVKVDLYLADDQFDWEDKDFDDAVVYVNNEQIDDLSELDHMIYGRFILNNDDEVEYAYLFRFDSLATGLVTEIDATDLDYVNLNADDDVLELDDAEEIYVFNKDFSQASLDDIKEDTAVFYWIDSDDNYYIVVSNETLEGTLEAVRLRDSRITVGGTNVKFAENNAIYSLDDKDDFKVLTNFADLEDYVDENVIVYLNLVGDTLAMVTDAEVSTSTIRGVATWLTSQRNPVLSVYTAEGKEVDYTFEETDDITADFKGLFTNGDPNTTIGVQFKINKDGEIKEDTFEFVDQPDAKSDVLTGTTYYVGDFDKTDDKKFGVVGGSGNLYITEDTVILKALNSTGNRKPSVIKYADIINKEIDPATDSSEAIVILGKGNNIALIIFAEALFQATDEVQFGILASDARVTSGGKYKADIDVAGKGKETYILSSFRVASGSTAAILGTGDLIEFELNEKGEVVIDYANATVIDYSAARASSYSTVASKPSTNDIKIGGTNYRNIAGDTVVYSTNKAGDVSSSGFGRVAADSKILYLVDGLELKVVLDITAYVNAKALTPAEQSAADIAAVVTEIAELSSPAVQGEVDSARAAYDALTPAQRALVTNYAALVAAEAELDFAGHDVEYVHNGIIEVTLPAGAIPSQYAVTVVGVGTRAVSGGYATFTTGINDGQIYTANLVKLADLTTVIATENFIGTIVSTDASITGIEVASVAATLDSGTTYDVTLPALTTYGASDIVVTTTDANATAATATGGTVDATSTWTVVVTAEDGTTTVTYTINVTVTP